MPTAAQMRSKLRAVLDDETSLWKQGTMWTDAQLDAALDAAQFAFVRYCYMKKQWHLISQLFTSIYGQSPLALPSNYLFYASATVDNDGVHYPAVLYIGWSGSLFDNDPVRYVSYIKNNTVEFKIGLFQSLGTLYYYRLPTRITGASNHTEMIDPCYDAIVYHALAILQQKDWGQCQRALKNMQAVLTPLLAEPVEMYPMNLNQNTDA
jgi:hypothetical protein